MTFQIPVNGTKPDLVLGEAFVPGHDETHFCAPTAVAVADTADFFFVADGYCNNRILKYSKRGNLVSNISKFIAKKKLKFFGKLFH